MSRYLPVLLCVALLGSLATHRAHSQDDAAVAQKMRESLRNTMLQLRTAQTEKATLEGKLTDSQTKEKSLQAKVDALAKQIAADKETFDSEIEQLREKSSKQETALAALKTDLGTWQKNYQVATATAEKKESERAALYSKSVVLERKVADHERKNIELSKVAKEILKRYESFGLGTALTAREPFVGITRTKIETLVQDFGDRVEDNRIKPDAAGTPSGGSTAGSPATPAPAAGRPPKTSSTQRIPGPTRTGRPGEQPRSSKPSSE